MEEPLAPIAHYENFPVASWLCPPHLRAPITAIYHFARTADDLADEGDASAAQRLLDLQNYRQDLDSGGASGRWPQVFVPLHQAIAAHALPTDLLHDLLDAFTQDVQMTAAGARYADMAALRDYCRRSANPVGRLLLYLYGVHDERALQRSDAICTALQLLNFWQDLSVDIPRGRYYLSEHDCRTFGVTDADMLARLPTENATQLIANYVADTRLEMQKGAELVHQIPGRAGWELRLVVQGGLRILDKIEALHYATLRTRPTLRWWDLPLVLWRALWM